jgi:DNA-nicking Smr family endonuclease
MSRYTSTLDLHGVQLGSAKRMFIKYMSDAIDAQKEQVDIITGRGNHINKSGSRGVMLNFCSNGMIDYIQELSVQQYMAMVDTESD